MYEDDHPCLDCKDRKVYSFNGKVITCHATCGRYINAVQRDKEKKTKIYNAKYVDTPKRGKWTKTRRESIAGRYGKGRK